MPLRGRQPGWYRNGSLRKTFYLRSDGAKDVSAQGMDIQKLVASLLYPNLVVCVCIMDVKRGFSSWSIQGTNEHVYENGQ
jgi:hypothetical protein